MPAECAYIGTLDRRMLLIVPTGELPAVVDRTLDRRVPRYDHPREMTIRSIDTFYDHPKPASSLDAYGRLLFYRWQREQADEKGDRTVWYLAVLLLGCFWGGVASLVVGAWKGAL